MIMRSVSGLTVLTFAAAPGHVVAEAPSRGLRGSQSESFGLCHSHGVSKDAVTQKICQDSADRCEAYIHKGAFNGKTVTTCADYCSAHNLQCLAQFDDDNACGRGEKYSDCYQSGGWTSDHICLCGPAGRADVGGQDESPDKDKGRSGLCSNHGVVRGDVTREICEDSVNTCEVYIKKGDVNGTSVKSCRDYCGAFNLGCDSQYEDSNGCGRGWKYDTCDEPDDSTSDHICKCVAPSEASPTPTPPPPPPPIPQACQDVWDRKAGQFTCGDRIAWLQTQGWTLGAARTFVSEQHEHECGDCKRTCEEVWDAASGDFTCGQRIEFLMNYAEEPMSERDAKDFVATMHEECAPCRPPPTPAPTPAPTAPPPPPPPPSPGSPARLLTFNVWWKNRRYEAIADLINEVHADVVNLQEAVPFGGEDKVQGILDALNNKGRGNWSAANPWNEDAYWCGLTIFRSDYWKEPEWTAAIPVWQNSHVSKERGICGSMLERRVDSTKVCVWGGHPGWTADSSPHWAMDLIARASEKMKECAETHNAPSVFMCDCNSADAGAIRGQLQASTEADWDVAAHYGYDQIFVTSTPPSANFSMREAAPAEAFGKVTHYNHQAVHEGACCAGQQDRACWRNAPMCSEWAYSDHPPVHVDIRLPLPAGSQAEPPSKVGKPGAIGKKSLPAEANLRPPPRLI
eukprot:TRINITY_DN122038_c0_g1_i1.p1 TRINITY_DN122038_c0_g1~~TRINITY_DN122038_c0_g1_i1.p1  ORF type:complete len:684 (+),score=149.35 TRINITY_DN122038_c0_g1_i1:88-2139(+)